jgi:hypothetical protein
MFQIDDTIVSLSVVEQKFICDLKACKGNCCRYGDSGAPLLPEEAEKLIKIWPDIRPFMRPEGIAVVENHGITVSDVEGDTVTPLIENEECAFTTLQDGVFGCAIEKAFSAGKTDFRKPLSCHLFPVRVKNYTDFKAVNYEEWPICKPAVEAGQRENVDLFKFLKDPLIRAFGNEWYKKLQFAAKEYAKQKWRWDK